MYSYSYYSKNKGLVSQSIVICPQCGKEIGENKSTTNSMGFDEISYECKNCNIKVITYGIRHILNDGVSIAQFGRELKNHIIDDTQIRGNKIYEILRKHKCIYKNNTGKNFAEERIVNMGYMKNNIATYYDKEATNKITITKEGAKWLSNKLAEFGYITFKRGESDVY